MAKGVDDSDITGTAREPVAAAAAGMLPRWRRSPTLLVGLTLAFCAFLFLPRVAANPHLTRAFAGVGGGLLAAELLLWLCSRARGRPFRIELAPIPKAHVVQGAVQLSIYAYWGWYWRDVYAELPLILAQFMFLCILDALLSWWLGRAWRLSLAPLPIVLSTNVFIWFLDDWFAWQFLLLATAILSKEFLKWERDGQRTHVFNPSAFALGLFSLALIATDTTGYTAGADIATTLFRPPHIYLQIFLLGLVVQYFFGVTLMTLSAAAVLVLLNVAYTAATGIYYFIDTNISIAVFLGFHLLVTDPKTSPRTHAGKLIFGALYGLSIWVLYWVLAQVGAPQFYDKLLPIPILNLCVRWIDRVARGGLAGAFDRWQAVVPARRLNLAHMGVWATLFAALLATGFVEAPHEGRSLGFWKEKYDEGRSGAGERLLQLVETRVAKDSGSACNALGAMYLNGDVVERHPAAAAYWFARACELGDERGCAHVVEKFLYLDTAFPPEVLERALASVEAACASVVGGSDCALAGLAYEMGRGRPRDLERAAGFYARGVGQGATEAAKGLARIRVHERRDPGDLAAALPLLDSACAAGDGWACLYLARLAFDGLGVPRDVERASELLQRGCVLACEEACAALATLPGR
jgi:hypothetical protein